MIMTIEDVRKGIAGSVLSQAARDTGIHRNTLRMIRDGKHVNPSYETMLRLTEWLEERGAQ